MYPLGLSVCRLGGAHEGFVSTNTWCRQSLCAHEDCVGRIQTLYAAFVGPIEPLHITFCGTGPTKPLRTVFVRPAQPLYKVSVRIPKSLWCTWALLSMQTIFASPLVLSIHPLHSIVFPWYSLYVNFLSIRKISPSNLNQLNWLNFYWEGGGVGGDPPQPPAGSWHQDRNP